MSLSHATTPLSGYEHVFSHVLDMAAEARQEPLGMHGAQVAMASLRTAIAYEIVLREFEPTRLDRVGSFPDPEGCGPTWRMPSPRSMPAGAGPRNAGRTTP